MINLHPKFLTKNGKKEFVVIPYEEFIQLQELLEDLEDLKDIRLAEEKERDSPDYSLEDAKEILDIS